MNAHADINKRMHNEYIIIQSIHTQREREKDII